jgi:sec-independent protein translocase protein TatA
MDVGPAELLIILAIVLLLFGSAKLPKLARSLGQAQKEFKQGLAEGQRDDPPVAAPAPPPIAAPPPTAADPPAAADPPDQASDAR